MSPEDMALILAVFGEDKSFMVLSSTKAIRIPTQATGMQ